MAQPDGTLKYDTLIDSNGFKSGLAKISNLAKTALQGAATLLASATAALSAGAMAGVKYNAQMEQYSRKLRLSQIVLLALSHRHSKYIPPPVLWKIFSDM